MPFFIRLQIVTSLLVSTALVTSTALAADISRVTFIQFMKSNGPSTLCSNSALLSCMEVTQPQCLTELTRVNETCASESFDKFPEFFEETEENTRFYGSQYSFCLLDQWKQADSQISKKVEQCFGR